MFCVSSLQASAKPESQCLRAAGKQATAGMRTCLQFGITAPATAVSNVHRGCNSGVCSRARLCCGPSRADNLEGESP
jgi:hypothetical protein